MPGFKTVFNLLIGGLLLVFYFWPSLFLPVNPAQEKNEEKNPAHGFPFRKVRELKVSGLPGQPHSVTLRREKGGRWTVDGHKGLQADGDKLIRLFNALNGAVWQAEPSVGIPQDPVTLSFHAGYSKSDQIKIALGPRRKTLQKQIVRVDDRTFEVNFDISACLGLWRNRPHLGGELLMDRLLLMTSPQSIKKITLIKPFAEYSFTRTDKVAGTIRKAGTKVEFNAWHADVDGTRRKSDAVTLYRYTRNLAMVPFERLPATHQKAPESLLGRWPHTVRLITEKDKEYKLKLSQRLDDKGSRLGKLVKPETTQPVVLSAGTCADLLPDGAAFVDDAPVIETRAEEAVRIAYRTKEHKCVLRQKENGKWKMVQPDVPYEIYTPLPMGSGPPPPSRAQQYVQKIARIEAEELFFRQTNRAKELLQRAFREITVEVQCQYADGTSKKLQVSADVGDTGKCFVRTADALIVADDRIRRRLAPDVKSFFDPEEVENVQID